MSAPRPRPKKGPAKKVLKSNTLEDLPQTKIEIPLEIFRQLIGEILKFETRVKEFAANQAASDCRIKALEMERIREKNLVIESKRNRYIWEKVRCWRRKWFYLVLSGPACWAIVFAYLVFQNKGSMHFSRGFIENYTPGYVFSSISALIMLFYAGFVVKNFADTYNKSSVNAFKASLKIPEYLQSLKVEE